MKKVILSLVVVFLLCVILYGLYRYNSNRNDFADIDNDYDAADLYVWNKDKNSSDDGIRYALLEHSEIDVALSEVYKRATTNFEDIKAEINDFLQPNAYVYILELYNVEGYEVDDRYISNIFSYLREYRYNCARYQRIMDGAPPRMIVQGVSKFTDEFFSAKLKSMEEDDLKQNSGEVYRFTCTPSFYNPYVIRIDVNSSGDGVLTYKECEFTEFTLDYSNDNGKLVENETKALTKSQVNAFLELVNKSNFWNMQVLDFRIGADGEGNIIEGVKDGNYHIAYRWTPESGEFYDLVMTFKTLRNSDK